MQSPVFVMTSGKACSIPIARIRTEPDNDLNYNVFVRFRFNPVMRKTFYQEHIVPEHFVPPLVPWPRFRFRLCLSRPSHDTRKVRAHEGCEYSLTAQGGFAEMLGLAAELCELMTPVAGTGQQPARAIPSSSTVTTAGHAHTRMLGRRRPAGGDRRSTHGFSSFSRCRAMGGRAILPASA